MTRKGYDGLLAKILELQTERESLLTKPSLNNAEQIREIETQIESMNSVLEIASVVDPTKQSGERVLFGATVTVADEDGQKHVYKIVGVDETDAEAGYISWISPIGNALLQKRVGDFAFVQTPHKSEDLEILKIEFL